MSRRVIQRFPLITSDSDNRLAVYNNGSDRYFAMLIGCVSLIDRLSHPDFVWIQRVFEPVHCPASLF